jgi:Copper transport outer membrane protein, MctB
MFDLRYHVASLAAVFFALVIGILVGVALASHGLGHAERQRLERDLRIAQSNNDSLQRALDEYQADHAFVGNAYDALMQDRLKGKRIGVLFVGSADRTVRSAVTRTVDDAGGTILRMRAITVPIDPHAVDSAIGKRPPLASFKNGPKRFNHIGVELADEFVVGGDIPIWNALENQLVEERRGSDKGPIDAVVVVRTVPPQTKIQTAQLLGGMLDELVTQPIPVAGVEARKTTPSAIPAFTRYGLSTVSDIDLPVGRVALAVVLAGTDTGNGHYGLRAGEDVAPKVPPITNQVTTGG